MIITVREKCLRVGESPVVAVCRAMHDVLQDYNGEPKGLAYSYGWPADAPADSKPRPLGIIYRERAKAQGQLLNVCPWCKADIRWWMTDEDHKAERDAGWIAATDLGEPTEGGAT